MFILLTCAAALLTSCSIPYEIPYGIWRNEELGITLDIFPKESGPHFGTYSKDNEDIEIFFHFGVDKSITIYDCKDFDFINNKWIATSSNPIFDGPFVVRGDKIHYTLRPYTYREEEVGASDTIIFERIE